MAIFWSIKNKKQVTEDIDSGKLNNDLVPIKHMDFFDRISELPTCENYYIKYIEDNNVDNHTGLFPVEMLESEKEIALQEYIESLKLYKTMEVQRETNRRIADSANENDIGTFLHIPIESQIFRVATAVVLLKKAINNYLNLDILDSLEPQEKAFYNSLETGDWYNVIQLDNIKIDIIANEIEAAATIEEIEAVKIKDNQKWII